MLGVWVSASVMGSLSVSDLHLCVCRLSLCMPVVYLVVWVSVNEFVCLWLFVLVCACPYLL